MMVIGGERQWRWMTLTLHGQSNAVYILKFPVLDDEQHMAEGSW